MAIWPVAVTLSLRTGTGRRWARNCCARSEQASDQVPAQTLDVCGVSRQGEIGICCRNLCRRSCSCRIEGTGGERGIANRAAAR